MINVELNSLKSLGRDSGSHFFGGPMFPKKLSQTKFIKEELFIGQINLSELTAYDHEQLLPRDGMVYIIFDDFTKKYTLFFSEIEPTVFMDGFNNKFDNYRYDHPLKLNLSVPDDDYELNKNCVKMLCPVPDNAKTLIKDADKYICFLKIPPAVVDNLGRHYLIPFEKHSLIIIKKKHLKKGKLSKSITINT